MRYLGECSTIRKLGWSEAECCEECHEDWDAGYDPASVDVTDGNGNEGYFFVCCNVALSLPTGQRLTRIVANSNLFAARA